MTRGVLGAAIAAATMFVVASAGVAQAKEAGDILVRARAVLFDPHASGSTDALGGDASIKSDTVPELDFSYFFTDHIATELILATTKHDVTLKNSSSGDLDLGTVRLLPPVLTLQYHFAPKEVFSPYLGAGINYTFAYDAKPGSSITSIHYDDPGFGYALQAGFDVKLAERTYFNVDIKKVWVDTKLKVNGGAINANDVKLDPLVVGIGIGYSF